jgi:hypothetical protein
MMLPVLAELQVTKRTLFFCQGEGRGFESRLPLQNACSGAVFALSLSVCPAGTLLSVLHIDVEFPRHAVTGPPAGGSGVHSHEG